MIGTESVWTNPTTHSTGSTTNTGPTIDLWASGVPAGGTYQGTGEQGVGVKIFQTQSSGTGQTTVWTYQTSSDNVTYHASGFLGTTAMDSASKVVRLKGTIRSFRRYVQIVATNSGTGTSTSRVYSEDNQALLGGNSYV